MIKVVATITIEHSDNSKTIFIVRSDEQESEIMRYLYKSIPFEDSVAIPLDASDLLD